MVDLGPVGSYTPRPGDLGITVITGWGVAIRAAQWLNGDGFADFEHAYTVTEVDPDGTVWILEAMPGGAQHVRNWHPADRTVYLRCPDEYRTAVAAAARSFEGVPYSVADYFSLAAHRLHIPAPHLRAYIRSSGHMICSQLVDRAATDGGWHLFEDGRWEGDVTPGDLYGLYKAQRAHRISTGDMSR
jgi:hypothetical protein